MSTHVIFGIHTAPRARGTNVISEIAALRFRAYSDEFAVTNRFDAPNLDPRDEDYNGFSAAEALEMLTRFVTNEECESVWSLSAYDAVRLDAAYDTLGAPKSLWRPKEARDAQTIFEMFDHLTKQKEVMPESIVLLDECYHKAKRLSDVFKIVENKVNKRG
jgi:hypothetical protein